MESVDSPMLIDEIDIMASWSSQQAVDMRTCTLVVWVRRLDSVANPLPQMVQWKGRFLARSTWASWFLRCCCRLDNWMNARPHSARWQRYGLSPASPQRITIEKQTTSDHRESFVKQLNNKYYHQAQEPLDIITTGWTCVHFGTDGGVKQLSCITTAHHH